MKKEYEYKVNLTAINDEIEIESKVLNFEITNHDNLFNLLALIQGKLGLNIHEEQAFLIGLKMFSETILKYRDNPLFMQMKQPMSEIMTILKNHNKNSI